METEHTYHVQTIWNGERLGVGKLRGQGLTCDVSIPGNLNGPGVGTSPEELLLSAAAGCYAITLCSLMNNRELPLVEIQLTSVGVVENEHGLRFDRIEHRPTIVVDKEVDEDTVLALAMHAEHACMVSSALRGNVIIKVFPQVMVRTAAV